ncbi:DUF3466 family protein [Azohydromonas caseinilytica]|uniref:Extracellular repeat, HAF family n=1 Tax=Azohydromonas caseinilytica TaxID=2728836 RepID=A0A848F811_9BURK|nr:DUF3466 family protein [Azohydromonas caseinilytica]NML15704.1 hypothetical protein [Azohydromonas caseinilytica]
MKRFLLAGLLVGASIFHPGWAQDAQTHSAAALNKVPPRYQVHALGTLENGSSYARSLNTRRQAAGYVTFNIAGEMRPALFELGKLPVPIYTDGPGEATGINADGEIVGWYLCGDKKQAFLWKNHQLQLLMSPVGGESVATAINDRSEIVGWFEMAPGVTHAFHYHKGRMTDLGRWGGRSAQATAINRKGEIVGFREKWREGRLVRQGVRLSRQQGAELLRPPAEFDNLVPSGINERGEVAGTMWASNRPFDFETFAFATREGQVVNLQRPGCCFGTAGVAINRKGQVVGYNFDRLGDPHENLTLWDPQRGQIGLSGLKTALDQGWYQLTEGNDINNDGVIVGAGVLRDQQRPFTSNRAVMLIPDWGR